MAVILVGTWGLLKDSVNLAMDGAPGGVAVREIEGALVALPGVSALHDLHVWGLSTTETAQRLMRDRFGIRHTTLQLEAAPLADCPGC